MMVMETINKLMSGRLEEEQQKQTAEEKNGWWKEVDELTEVEDQEVKRGAEEEVEEQEVERKAGSNE